MDNDKSKLKNVVNNSGNLLEYLNNKGKNHNYFKFYTEREEVVNNILNTHSIYLSRGDNWNDLADRNRFNPDGSDVVRYGICFSFTRSESVAMWMLYAKDSGYMMDFGSEIINQCLDIDSIDCGTFRGKGFENIVTLNRDNFKIEILDIVYFDISKNDSSKFYIKRADEHVDECDKNVVDQIKFCKKTLPWSYECECRLIVTINNTIEDIDKCDTVKVSFGEKSLEKLKKRIYHSPNTKSGHTYNKSKLTGKIEWNISGTTTK